MDLCYERAKADDIEAIRDLEEEAFGLTWDRATFERELIRENGVTVVAKTDELVIGSALLVWAADEVQLNSIVLQPSWRGRGLSVDFLGSLLAWCQEQNFSWITLEVKWVNPPAQRLYERFGFVTTAKRPRYYRDDQDARIMWAGHLQSPHFWRELANYRGRCPLLRKVS